MALAIAARVISGDIVRALAHQLGDEQPAAHLAQHAGKIVLHLRGVRFDLEVMRTAGIARRLHAQLARRVRRQKISFQDAIAHDVAAHGAYAFFIERGRADAADDVRVFLDRDMRREDGRAQRVIQKGRFAVQRTARRGLHQRAQQAGSERCFEQDRARNGAHLARIQARQRAFGGVTAHGFRLRHFGGIAA